MARQAIDPSWPLAVLFCSLTAAEAKGAGGDSGQMWVYDGRPLHRWRLEPLAAIRGSDYVLPFHLIPRSLWVPTADGYLVEIRARFFPRLEPLTKRSRARSGAGAVN
jgi:hypothetical protein